VSLLDRARAQDPLAWSRLLSLYEPLIFLWCRQGTLPKGAAEEVRQEVFKRVFVKLKDFRRDAAGQSFRRWLRTITRNCVCDYWRRNPPATAARGGDDRALEDVPVPHSGSDAGPPSPAEEDDERKVVLRQALRQIERDFAQKTWRAFWQVVVADRSPAEVAEELGLSVNAVYLAKARVLQRLREEFQGVLDEP
jgi:RNA polymerase sigma-70 factor (ECF subfamily)